MSQFDFGTINPDTKTGTDLASDLGSWRDALNSLHRGATRPAYAAGGMLWVREVSGTLWELNIFDGTNDVVIARINPSTGVFSLPNDSVGNAAMQANAVNAGNIVNLAITAAKLAANAVETAKILNLAVTNDKIANATIQFGKIAASALATQAEAEAGASGVKLMTAARVAQAIAALGGGAFEDELLHVRDEKASGTDAGTFAAGAWRTRDLNTVKTNLITGASLSSNRITLPAGTYYAEGSAPAIELGRHKVRFRNVTNNSTALLGTSTFASAVGTIPTRSYFSGRFTVGGPADFEIQHRCQATRADIGFGGDTSFGENEVYAEVKLWKVG